MHTSKHTNTHEYVYIAQCTLVHTGTHVYVHRYHQCKFDVPGYTRRDDTLPTTDLGCHWTPFREPTHLPRGPVYSVKLPTRETCPSRSRTTQGLDSLGLGRDWSRPSLVRLSRPSRLCPLPLFLSHPCTTTSTTRRSLQYNSKTDFTLGPLTTQGCGRRSRCH